MNGSETEDDEVQHDGASSSGSACASWGSGDEEEVEERSCKEEAEADPVRDEEGVEERHETEGDHNSGGGAGVVSGDRGGSNDSGGVTDTVLLLIVRCVLTGIHGFLVLRWVIGKVSEGLAWFVELGMLLLGQPIGSDDDRGTSGR